jgi:hypothetical protein
VNQQASHNTSTAPEDSEKVAPWPVFLCYRQLDGSETAAWLYDKLNDSTITEDGRYVGKLDVYLDRRAPAAADWRDIHLPALQRARSLLVIITPGLPADLGPDDWVQQELGWWLKHRRKVAPLLIETTPAGDRLVPKRVVKRWPYAQRIRIDLAGWSKLSAEEAAKLATIEIRRILDGIQINERKVVYEDLERTKRLARNLIAALSFAVLALLAAGVAYCVPDSRTFLTHDFRAENSNVLWESLSPE